MKFNRVLSFKEVRQLTGLSRSTVWKLERESKFPRRRLLTTNRVGWIESEVLTWINERMPVCPEDSDVKPKHNLPSSRDN